MGTMITTKQPVYIGGPYDVLFRRLHVRLLTWHLYVFPLDLFGSTIRIDSVDLPASIFSPDFLDPLFVDFLLDLAGH